MTFIMISAVRVREIRDALRRSGDTALADFVTRALEAADKVAPRSDIGPTEVAARPSNVRSFPGNGSTH